MSALLRRSLVVFAWASVAGIATAQPPLPRYRLVPEMRIDGAREEFARIGGFLVARDGRVVLPLERDRVIVVYSASGGRLNQFGRAGSGPGELQNLDARRLGWVGDTLWAYDGTQRRLNWFALNGELLRTQLVAPPTGPLADSLSNAYPIAVFAGGGFLGAAGERSAQPGGGRQFHFTATSGSLVQRIVAVQPQGIGAVYVRDGNMIMPWSVPFFSHPFDHVAADGSRFARVTTTLGSGLNGSYRITVWRGSGDTLFSRAYAFSGERVSPRSRDSAMSGLESRRSRSPVDAEMHRRVNEQVPAVHRPIEGFRLGEDETIWLQLRSSGNNLYRLLDGRGNPVAEVILPLRTELVRASRTHIWAVERDADDVPSIVRFRILPSG